MSSGSRVSEARIAPEHPATDGHFPGKPVLPGAVLLDLALQAVAAAGGPAVPLVVEQAKFPAPVTPGCTLRFEVEATPSRARFSGSVDGKTVIAGSVHSAARA